MNLKLTRNPEEIKRIFTGLSDKKSVADLLEVDFSTIVYLLYRRDKPTPYKRIELKKRSGGVREIYAPISTLKILQRKLAYILSLIYRPRLSVYGFCKNRNISDNAQQHVRKKLVLNIDLNNFFPSIHIGRVIGLFKAKPFNFSREVAVLLAQICCYEGKLPQGAPTSPIISNMICAGLDKDLQSLAKKHFCSYSRYADDITFSTTSEHFKPDIVSFDVSTTVCGEKLSSIIESHSFIINQAKVKLINSKKSQRVTGLTVNQFANISRKFIREIRTMLYAWKKFKESGASEYYQNNIKILNQAPHKRAPAFHKVVKGKIDFVKLIKGEKNPIYRKLLNKYNKLINPNFTPLPIDEIDELKAALWVVKVGDKQLGTAFMLDSVGLITCSHVVGKTEQVIVHRWENTGELYKAVINKKNQIPDLAILDIEHISQQVKFPSLKRGDSRVLKERDRVAIAGFPSYRNGDGPQYWDAKISAIMNSSLAKNFTIDRPIYKGMSGSPVVNKENEVVGVAMFGAELGKAESVWDYSITPIHHLDNMF